MDTGWLPGGNNYHYLKNLTFSFKKSDNKAIDNDRDDENAMTGTYLIVKEGKPIAIVGTYECDNPMQKGDLIILQGHDATSFFDLSTEEFSIEYTR